MTRQSARSAAPSDVGRRAGAFLVAVAAVLAACSSSASEPGAQAAPGVPHPRNADHRVLQQGTHGGATWTLSVYPNDLAPEICFAIDVQWVRPGGSGGVGGPCVPRSKTFAPGEVQVLVDENGRADMLVGITAPDVTAVRVSYAGSAPNGRDDVPPRTSTRDIVAPTSRSVHTTALAPWMEGRAFAVLLPRLTTVSSVVPAADAPTDEPVS